MSHRRVPLWMLSILVALAVTGSGCAAGQGAAVSPSSLEGGDIPTGKRYSMDQNDPLEAWNRRVYGFNYVVDRYVWLPTVRAYRYFTPKPVARSVHNFFDNIENVTDLANNVAQLKLDRAGLCTLRLAVNTTAGLGGLFDPASHVGLLAQQEDFGQTLGHWGVGPGPYLVLPFLGPSSIRDGIGWAADAAWMSWIHPFAYVDPFAARAALYGFYAVDERASVDFRYYGSGSPFEYEAVRTLYLRYRRIQVDR